MAMSVVYTTVNGQVLSENRGGVVHHFIPDPLGTVVMVRDTSGNTVYEAEYAPYGDVQSETGTNPSELGYVGTLGYVKDSASSLYVRARYLLTNLGRWLTKDPLWPSQPGYVYADATATLMVDPSGLIGCGVPCAGCEKWLGSEKEACASIKGLIGVNPNYKENLNTITVCCNKRTHVCLGTNFIDDLNGMTVADKQKVKHCAYLHEHVHRDQLNSGATACMDWDGNPSPCGIVGPGRPGTLPKVECPGYFVQGLCMLDSFGGDPCKNGKVCKVMCDICRGLDQFKCGPSQGKNNRVVQCCEILRKSGKCSIK